MEVSLIMFTGTAQNAIRTAFRSGSTGKWDSAPYAFACHQELECVHDPLITLRSFRPLVVIDESNASDNTGFGACGWALIIFSYILVALTFPISLWMCIKVSFLPSSTT